MPRPLRLVALILGLLLPPVAVAQTLPGVLDALPAAARADHAEAERLAAAGDWQAALAPAARALALARDQLGPDHGATIQLAVSHVQLLDRTGQGEAALAEIEALVATVRQRYSDWSPYRAFVEIEYANQLANAGRVSEALPVALGVTRQVGQLFGENSPMTAVFLRDAGQILRRLGHLDEALATYRRIVPIFDAAGGPDDARAAAGAMFLQGDVLDRLGRTEEALAAYADADRRASLAYGPRHAETLAIRLARARAASALADYAQVRQIIDESLPLVVELFGAGSLQHGTWLRVLAWAEADAAGDARAGLPTMETAVAMVTRALPDSHRVTGETRADYAAMLSYAGRHAEAWAQYELSEPAAGHDRKFMLDTLSFLQEAGALDEATLAAEVLPHLQRIAGGAARGAVREQVLRQQIRNPEARALYREATDLVEERLRLEAELADLAGRPQSETDPAREAGLRDRLSELAAGITDRMARVRALEPGLPLLTGDADLSLPEVQAALGPDEAVILIDHQRHDEEWSIAVAITRDRAVARFFWVQPDDLRAWTLQVRGSVGLTLGVRGAAPLGDDPAPDRRVFPAEAAVELYRNSLGVVSDVLAPDSGMVPHLYVEFRGPMTGLPPTLLMPFLPDPGTPPTEMPYLVRWHAFTLLPSLSALRGAALAEAADRAPEGFAGFADPVFDGAAEGQGATGLRAVLVPLPETADEARAVRELAAGGAGPLWLGGQASEAQAKAAPLDRYRMLYFATHGLVAGDRAGGTLLPEPALALTPGQGEDGFLTASEIAGLRLNADWVVLSACNTAQGSAPGAEALSGLAQAFLYAGARSLLVSHWPVESRSAVRLMTDTFRFRSGADGLPAALAHQQAMLAMIEAPPRTEWSHPAYWAPFVLVGSPD